MVTSTQQPSQLTIVARPNQSANWRTNQLLLLALCVPSLGAAIGFSLMGAWPILPFAGLEMLSLGAALYYVSWKLQYRQVITVSEDSVSIDKGYYAPKKSYRFHRDDAGLAIRPEKHPWDGPDLWVHSDRERVNVGEFLNRDDSLKLAALLREVIRVRSESPDRQRSF
ncbi:MAG: DUF2244 domain-containing protein [Pseudomonadota bacterium]